MVDSDPLFRRAGGPIMDLRQIQHFLAAVEHGNLTRAAAALQISQPALSKSIRQLERRLDVRLLERGRFGVSPTPFGETLASHGKAIAAELRHAASEIDALRGAQRGHVVMGCGPSEATRLLPLALDDLLAQNPEIRTTVHYGLNEALMPWVRQGDVDFALSSVPASPADPELTHDRLYEDAASIVARAEHPLAKKRRISAEDLAGCNWVLARRQELERRAVDDYFRAQGLPPPEATIETTSTVLMKSVVSQTDFLTLLPRDLIYWEEHSGNLVSLPVAGLSWTRFVGITRRRRGSLSPASRALIDAIRRIAAGLGQEPKSKPL